MDDRPIGMFDSGFGGLTVARALIDLLPGEDLVYVGDTGRYPYGTRALEEVAGFAHEITRFLVEKEEVKMVVVACNTASAAALDSLRMEFTVPVVGVIDPGILAAVKVTSSGRVGVIGTEGTIRSGAYERALGRVRAPVDLSSLACPGFVELVERGEVSGPRAEELVAERLEPLLDDRIDTLLLGCTHYPFLARSIGEVLGRDVVLVSSADETAFEVRSILVATGLGRRGARGPGRHRFLSSGDRSWFLEVGRRLFGEEIECVESVPWA